MLTSIIKILSSLVSLYTLLVILRIIMTWFQGPHNLGAPMRYLSRITDPYLLYFRRFSFLQIGQFDFSPVAALILLSVTGNILNSIAAFGKVTLGLVLALVLSAIWSAVAFFLVLFVILVVIRIIGLAGNFNSASPFWRTLDMILHPVLLPISGLLLGGQQTTYLKGLITGGAILLALRILGGYLVNGLIIILQRLPF